MSESNGQGDHLEQRLLEARQQLRLARTERALHRTRLEARILERSGGSFAISEGYGGLGGYTGYGFGDLVDPADSFRDPDLPWATVNVAGRRDQTNQAQPGGHWPIIRSEFDLDEMRGAARTLVDLNDHARGALETLRNFTIRTGYKYQAQGKKKAPQSLARLAEHREALAEVVQERVEHFLELNQWSGREQEAFERSKRDGDIFHRHFVPDPEEGHTLVRVIEPEQVRQPMGSPREWSWGIRHKVWDLPDGTQAEDVETPVSYAVHEAINFDDWEEVPAGEVAHLKLNVDRTIKRGISDFFSTRAGLEGVRKVRDALRAAAKIQASIAWIEQFESASQQNVQNAVNNLKDQLQPTQNNPVTGKPFNFEKFNVGTILKIGKGKQYLPPPMAAANANVHIAIAQFDLRSVGARWCMPEFMISGDASNANYASTLVSGSPFVIATETTQQRYQDFFLVSIWLAIRNYADAGLIVVAGHVFTYVEIRALIDIHVTAPQVAIANDQQQAQIDAQDMQAGVLSVQTRREKRGLDNDREETNIAEEAKKKAQQQPQQPGSPGATDAPPAPGAEQQAPPSDMLGANEPAPQPGQQDENRSNPLAALGLTEALLEAVGATASASPPASTSSATSGAAAYDYKEFQGKHGRFCMGKTAGGSIRRVPCRNRSEGGGPDQERAKTPPGEHPTEKVPATVDNLHAETMALKAARKNLSPEDYHKGLRALAERMGTMSVADLQKLAEKLNASGVRAALVPKIVEHFKAPVEAPPEPAPDKPVAPARPAETTRPQVIVDRLQGRGKNNPFAAGSHRSTAYEMLRRVIANIKSGVIEPDQVPAATKFVLRNLSESGRESFLKALHINRGGRSYEDALGIILKQLATTPQPKEKADEPGAKRPRDGEGSERTGAPSATAGGAVAPEAPRPASDATGDRGVTSGQPASEQAPARVPLKLAEISARLDRMERFFRSRGKEEQAGWIRMVRDHMAAVGPEAALAALGEERGEGEHEKIQYLGAHGSVLESGNFVGKYLERYGITPLYRGLVENESGDVDWSDKAPYLEPYEPLFSTYAGQTRDVSFYDNPQKPKEGDYVASMPVYKGKLEEAKLLPGLESSEDLSVIAGGEKGGHVASITPELMSKLDEKYGKDKWIVKPYGSDAWAGFAIMFPQRARQLTQDARNTIWDAGSNLAKYGFHLDRDKEGKITGIKHSGGDAYNFGTPEYENTIHGDARHWADQAKAAAANEHGVALPKEAEHLGVVRKAGAFMAQPAFPVVGVSEQERAAGKVIVKGEGRCHIITRNGKAEVIPHATWIKNEPVPVVFENEDTLAMAKAAQDAIHALPESSRAGQVYSPDVIRTPDGYKVIELNAARGSGGGGYLTDNPFIIDAFVSHLAGREPAHVRFIRSLIEGKKATKTKEGERRTQREAEKEKARLEQKAKEREAEKARKAAKKAKKAKKKPSQGAEKRTEKQE